LNANENPDGPPDEVKQALSGAIAEAGRYNHRVFPSLNAALAKSVGLEPDQIIPGAGSTEVLHCALDAFTSAAHPLITAWPTWEMAQELTEAAGRVVVKVPLMKDWSADVERMCAEAKKAGGGVIHFGNPNNPTSSITAKSPTRWLAENLPASIRQKLSDLARARQVVEAAHDLLERGDEVGEVHPQQVDVVGSQPAETAIYRPEHGASAVARLQHTTTFRTSDRELRRDGERVAPAV